MTKFTPERIREARDFIATFGGTDEVIYIANEAFDEIERLQKEVNRLHSDAGYDLEHMRHLQERLDQDKYL